MREQGFGGHNKKTMFTKCYRWWKILENPDHQKFYNVTHWISIDLLNSNFIKSNGFKS